MDGMEKEWGIKRKWCEISKHQNTMTYDGNTQEDDNIIKFREDETE